MRTSTTTSANNQAHEDEPSAQSTTKTIWASSPSTDFNQKPPNIQKLALSFDPEKEKERLIQKRKERNDYQEKLGSIDMEKSYLKFVELLWYGQLPCTIK